MNPSLTGLYDGEWSLVCYVGRVRIPVELEPAMAIPVRSWNGSWGNVQRVIRDDMCIMGILDSGPQSPPSEPGSPII